MKRSSEIAQMRAICQDNIEAAEDWIGQGALESTEIYWKLIKNISETWLDGQKKRPAKRRAVKPQIKETKLSRLF